MKKTLKEYNMIDLPPLTEDQKKELALLEQMTEEEIDLSDIPEQTGDGQFYYYQSLRIPKQDIHTKIDVDNLEWLKKDGKGYQARLNAVLRWARLNGCPISKLA